MSRRRGSIVLAVVPVLVATACSTRLPDSAFSSAPGPIVSAGGVSSTPSHPAPSREGAGNTASDTGVTASTVRVGIIASLTSPLGGDVFAAPSYGAHAHFDALNARGGVHGRTVTATVCDDGASGSGDQ